MLNLSQSDLAVTRTGGAPHANFFRNFDTEIIVCLEYSGESVKK